MKVLALVLLLAASWCAPARAAVLPRPPVKACPGIFQRFAPTSWLGRGLSRPLRSPADVVGFFRTVSDRDLLLPQALRDFQPFPYSSVGRARLYTAELDGRRVLVKIPKEQGEFRMVSLGKDERRRLNFLTIEAAFSKLLSDRGLGPRFHGLTRVKIGRETKTALVMDIVPDAHFVRGMDADAAAGIPGFRAILPAVEAQLRDAGAKLAELGVRVDDFQYLVDSSGKVTLIDPEFYEIAQPYLQFSATESARLNNEREVSDSVKWLRRAMGPAP